MVSGADMDSPPLPQLIVIGAAKAATTWIAHQLRTRPDVCMPGPEPHYFSQEFRRGEDWYRSLFADARPGQLVAEKSADYLAHPEAPARIAALLPAVRLIAQLRNPVERAYSHYCMLFRRGQIDGDVDRHLDGKRAIERRFLEEGLYGRHIQRFLDYFPQAQLKVILHDEIKRDPAAVTASLLRTRRQERQVRRICSECRDGLRPERSRLSVRALVAADIPSRDGSKAPLVRDHGVMPRG